MICCQASPHRDAGTTHIIKTNHLDAGTSCTPCYEHADRNGGITMPVADLPAFIRLLGVNVLHRSPERSEAELPVRAELCNRHGLRRPIIQRVQLADLVRSDAFADDPVGIEIREAQ